MPVKPLSFKGDKKPSKKRKHHDTSLSTTATTDPSSTDPSTSHDEDTSWTTPDAPTDLSGPVIIVLPTLPATVLASDAHGNIFASQLENIVENVPETAEPHDVRQVWVASSVAGTGQINLKASHGGFLSCDSIGVLGARREARGHEEGFVVEQITTPADGKTRWRLGTSAGGEKGRRYISTVVSETSTNTNANTKSVDDDDENQQKKQKNVSVSLRGDGEADSETTHIVIKMQARFKPRVQQNKETKANEKISRRELEQVVGRKLEDDEVRRLKRAKRQGTYYEEVLDVRVKGKHDKFAS
ncbi:hypothetical protein H2202_005043 [Exophiala xenobiotica]|nr:hypothetical protein H2202_005043 [Exophiala xenobiotica]KAK5216205.1 hypothetical protein LTR72_010776 [Exophiala xenobiotica]KAK5233357.1 hypothetical protein LTR47_005450 [Exophiala xenobiotica]KAK5245855.1 hypothetical protein LTS06_008755 [Exophiala xenobiotica]KAK5277179.1 hypothetical protein LTR40_010707 [Exophiala xenobiotica]